MQLHHHSAINLKAIQVSCGDGDRCNHAAEVRSVRSWRQEACIDCWLGLIFVIVLDHGDLVMGGRAPCLPGEEAEEDVVVADLPEAIGIARGELIGALLVMC